MNFPTIRISQFCSLYSSKRSLFATLMDVINFYSDSLVQSNYANPLMHKLNPPWGNGAELIPSQKQDLLNFLLTLTDEDFLVNPKFSKPADLPNFP